MRRHIDRNVGHHNLFDRFNRKPFRSSSVSPEVFISPMWQYGPGRDENSPSMEIIELNSSGEMVSPGKQTNCDNQSTHWDNDGLENIENCYKINREARDQRRRMLDAKTLTETSDFLSTTYNVSTNFGDKFLTNASKNDIEKEFNREMNFFTEFNKNVFNSDTSSEEFCDADVLTSADLIMDASDWKAQHEDLYNEEIITYDANIDQETRTIWIYSFKNKHLLRDGDFKEDNPDGISSSNQSNSTDSSGEEIKEKRRIGSPVPASYIPRLDLSLVPTLSTVTEVSDGNTISPKETTYNATPSITSELITSPNKRITKTNNWFMSESVDEGRGRSKHEKSTNVINWMGLSPRERRRVLKAESSDTWVGSNLILADFFTNNTEERVDRINKGIQNDAVKMQIDVEVHANINKKSEDSTEYQTASNRTSKSYNKERSSLNDIKYADATTEDFDKDRGDHSVRLVVAPAIRLTSKNRSVDFTKISDPIEKLENSDWIRETNEERETNVYNYELERSESLIEPPNLNKSVENTDVLRNKSNTSLGKTYNILDNTDNSVKSVNNYVENFDNSIDRLWMRNTVPFLKPSEWNEFVDIADTPLSLHLSLGSIVDERKSWFKRFINYFLKCCK